MGIKTLAVLTSGGDCAGLNAVIRAVTHHAIGRLGCNVVGIHDGHLGLLEDPPRVTPLTIDTSGTDFLRAGGTLLGTTTKGDPFAFPDADGHKVDRSKDVIAALKSLGVDAMVVIGGDGSMRLFHRLLKPAGISWIGVPKTIDNDVPGTEFAVGFFTAVEVVTDTLDRLATTAASHRRIMVLEVMGRDSGFIALFGGIAGGADVILMPEIGYDIDALTAHVKQVTHDRPKAVLVVVAEGAARPPSDRRSGGGVGAAIAHELQTRTGFDARCTVLGHVQRGGTPAAFDRLLASSFGVRAVDLLAQGQSGRLVVWRAGLVDDVALDDVVGGPRFVPVDGEMVRTARGLGIYVGETPF
jgi:6-phosphofructokinase 1